MRWYPLAPAEPTPTSGAYPSWLSDAEWAVLQPLLQRPATPQGGRPPKHPLRVIVDAIRYLVRSGCAWRVRVQAGRRPTPTAAIVDSQSVRTADTMPRASRGWDAGKKVNGRKRHLAVDTLGLLLAVMVTAASVQDRDAARPLLWRLRMAHRGLRLVWADASYAGRLVARAAAVLPLVVEIVRKRPGQSTFEVLPPRWVVERTLAWISKHRRTVRDDQRLPAHHAAMVAWAMVAVMTRWPAGSRRPSPIQLRRQ
jgi:transposase